MRPQAVVSSATGRWYQARIDGDEQSIDPADLEIFARAKQREPSVVQVGEMAEGRDAA